MRRNLTGRADSREPNGLVNLQRGESKNGGCVIREDSVQLEDDSNKMRCHQEALHLEQLERRQERELWKELLGPSCPGMDCFCFRIQFPWRKEQPPCSNVSLKGRPGIELPGLANKNTGCPVKFQFQVLHRSYLH